ncbi:hypothetical protein AUJ10_01975 [Candidatus Pacearchaeota archaeon CG1_02_31_27]|nr:MAG: hypothetical protein AUJ10_01975 [Candidatus Pacearchaeota archaeon CG1_02_31_27]PIN92563.1 MAG: hypothetical protein COU55_00025 [Candidatus Pacearchaeota archaeon CG10_big_fil_rev_8_21_14_0_10_31_59]PIZ80884.1 MAG: hypothetical protein COX99_01425 [Candidatus Pacearchaeota archaeon CG_4_10_14_0_2_um_filter_31_10]
MKKKAQEEIVGFAIVLVIILIVGVVIIGFMLRQKPEVEQKNRQVSDLLNTIIVYSPGQCNGNQIKDLLIDVMKNKPDGSELCVIKSKEFLAGSSSSSNSEGELQKIMRATMGDFSSSSGYAGIFAYEIVFYYEKESGAETVEEYLFGSTLPKICSVSSDYFDSLQCSGDKTKNSDNCDCLEKNIKGKFKSIMGYTALPVINREDIQISLRFYYDS